MSQSGTDPADLTPVADSQNMSVIVVEAPPERNVSGGNLMNGASLGAGHFDALPSQPHASSRNRRVKSEKVDRCQSPEADIEVLPSLASEEVFEDDCSITN